MKVLLFADKLKLSHSCRKGDRTNISYRPNLYISTCRMIYVYLIL